ncbi:MAG: serine/threonine protein kinase [Planctomycetaceae bacterium]|nr:serine/threonine protein kinase [Planctomycetaceae bacterium]
MADTMTCPKCSAELPGNAPSGICPKCLMLAALGNPEDSAESPVGSAFAPTSTPPGVFVPPEPESLAPHFPQLEILESLGHGGMGAVYKARQTKLDRFVALKIIRPETAEDEAFAERFNREARTLARLNHPNIVAVHDFGEVILSDPDDENATSRTLYYFLMEYVDGANLRQMILSGGLESDQTLAIIPQICEGLQFAHDEGVVHRDIKPENVLVDRRGRVKIADFGLAKLVAQSPDDFTLTGTHQVMGTPRYMAPEQMAGSHSVDHRADIFSLGVVFYEMLTGALPMGRFEPPSIKAAIDVRFDDIVHLALASDPDQRYQRASEIRLDIESIVLEQYSAISQAGGEQHALIPNPGLSTILENQVAGVVNRFRRQPANESHLSLSPQQSPADREVARRAVRNPSIALMVWGVFMLGASVPFFGLGWGMLTSYPYSPTSAAFFFVLSALAIVLAGIVIRGGWHALSLERLRPALLASMVGQPVGMWALIELSRHEVRAAFAIRELQTTNSLLRLLLRLLLNSTFWGCLLCAAGIYVSFFPWGELKNSPVGVPGIWFSAAGFSWPHGMAACFSLISLTLFLLATATLRPMPIWRPIVAAVLGVVVLVSCGSFIAGFGDGTLAVQPLLHAAESSISIEGRPPVTISESSLITRILNGPYLLMWIVVGLIMTAALDFRVALRSVSEKPKRSDSVKSPAARTSGKAIVGACLAPLAVVPWLFVMKTAGGMIAFVAFALVGLPALLAAIATTVLGIMALGDIRRSNGKLTGFGLAFFDAALFPIFLLDVLIYGLVYAAMWGGGSVTIGTAAVLCVIVDTLILRSAWRKVSSASAESEVHQRDIGTPLANVRFAIPDGEEIGSRVIFHFSGLGYQLIDEQADVWIFERGQPMGGLWSMKIQDFHTTLTVRTTAGNSDELLVSCDWSVRTLGGWVSGGDIKKLKAEGQQLQPLLGGGDDGKQSASKSSKRRFSRKAFVGVCWAAFFFVVIVPTAFIVQEGHAQERRAINRRNLERIGKNFHIETDSGDMQRDAEGRPIGMQQFETQPSAWAVASADSGDVVWLQTWGMLFAILIGIPAAIAPFGTTILGYLAIRDICNSRGRLSGLRLAFFDVVCFPTLVANIVIIGVVALIVGPTNNELIMLVALFGGLPLLFLADLRVLQQMWRGVAESVDDGVSNDAASLRPEAGDPTITNA